VSSSFSRTYRGGAGRVLAHALALSAEEQALKSGIVSILWEMGSTHIKVTEQRSKMSLLASPEPHWEGTDDNVIVPKLSPEEAKKEFVLSDAPSFSVTSWTTREARRSHA